MQKNGLMCANSGHQSSGCTGSCYPGGHALAREWSAAVLRLQRTQPKDRRSTTGLRDNMSRYSLRIGIRKKVTGFSGIFPARICKHSQTQLLSQEVLDNHGFCLFFAETECSEFHELFIVDPADGGFVDDLGVYVFCVDLGDGADLRLIHDDGVALDMCVALVISDRSGMKYLSGRSFSDGTGDDPGRAKECIRSFRSSKDLCAEKGYRSEDSS